MSQEDDERKKKKKVSFKTLVLILLIFALAGMGTYFFLQNKQLQKQLVSTGGTNQKANEEEAKKLTEEIGKVMVLPKEQPTVATVSDMKKLKEQPFFKNAQNGDKVLFFQKAQIAILYNPKLKKLINVGPINLVAQSSQAKIMILNGTSIAGLTTKAETQLKQSFPGIKIEEKAQANQTYTKTRVIALTPTSKKAAQTLAEQYNVSLSQLPAIETKPSGIDILIILGSDYGESFTTPTPPPTQGQ